MSHILYLTKDENIALTLLSQGVKSHAIQRQCVVPLSGMGFFTAEIRNKTGIRDTRNPRECQKYLRDFAESMELTRPSILQVNIMRMLLERNTHEGIAHKLEIIAEQIPQLIADFNKRAGIFTEDPKCRRAQWRLYLAAFHPECTNPLTPMPEDRWSILRLLADGLPYSQIADDLKMAVTSVRLLAREACSRLGLSARGRNTQRQLIRAYLTNLDNGGPRNNPAGPRREYPTPEELEVVRAFAEGKTIGDFYMEFSKGNFMLLCGKEGVNPQLATISNQCGAIAYRLKLDIFNPEACKEYLEKLQPPTMADDCF